MGKRRMRCCHLHKHGDFLDQPARDMLADLEPGVTEVANGSFKLKQPPYIQGSGYVVRGMEAALWAFHSFHLLP